IWAMGLRNPFSFAVQPGTGRIYINDVGEATWEEIDEGKPAANFGWPASEGPSSQPGFQAPVYTYKHVPDGQYAITGGAFYNPLVQQFPDDYAGNYFFVDFCAGWMRRLNPATGQATEFASGLPLYPIGLDIDAAGSLYFVSRGYYLAGGTNGPTGA